MNVKNLMEFYCSAIGKVPMHIFQKSIVECLIKKDKSIVTLGTDGEFHYLYATPFKSEKEKLYYFAKEFEKEAFDEAYSLELPSGYWVYEYATLVNLYIFHWFETLEEAQNYYNELVFKEDDLLFEKAIFYLSSEKKECIIHENYDNETKVC